MDPILEIVHQQTRGFRRTPIFVTIAKEDCRSFFKANGIAVITETHLEIFKQKNGKHKVSFFYMNLNQMVIEKDHLVFRFVEKKFSLYPSLFDQFVGTLMHVLTNIVPYWKKKQLNILSTKLPKIRGSSYSSYVLFNELIKDKDSSLSSECKEKLYEIFKYSCSSVDLRMIPQISLVSDELFSVINLIKHLDTIKIPSHLIGSIIRIGTDCLKKLGCIFFYEKRNKEMESLLSSMRGFIGAKIKALSFTESEFNIKDIDVIKDIVIENKIVSLSLNNAFVQDSVHGIYSLLSNTGVFNSLVSLSLDDTKGLNLNELFPKLSSINHLSLAGCGIQVFEITQSISSFSFSFLKTLCISRNPCIVSTSPNIILPKQLFKPFSKNHLILSESIFLEQQHQMMDGNHFLDFLIQVIIQVYMN